MTSSTNSCRAAAGRSSRRLQAAEKELARLEELLPLDAQRENAQRAADTARQNEQALHAECADHRKNWRRLLAENGLPLDLAPHQLHEHYQGRKRIRGLDRSLEQKNDELTRRRSEYTALTERITRLVAEVGITPRSRRPLDQLHQCLTELAEQQAHLKRREELTAQAVHAQRRAAAVSQAVDRLRRRRAQLLRAAGAHDEQELRRRAAHQADRQRLQTERDQLVHEITAALAGHGSEEELTELLSGA